MNPDLINLVNRLETEKPSKVLFSSKKNYNYCIGNINQNLFILVCNNFFSDLNEVNNVKINTIKYWFLHNLSLILNNNKGLIKELAIEHTEIDILFDYYRVIYFGKERQTDEFIFLPTMNMFSSWCNVTNQEKIEIHHKIIEDLIYLDDNYFFLINYLKMHCKKFLGVILKNKSEMSKGNNIMIHLFRSASYKNNPCAFRNFKKIVLFLFEGVWENKFLDILMLKNNSGKRAINMLVYLREDFYNVILVKIINLVSFNVFMEKYFGHIMKKASRAFHLAIIFDIFDTEDFLKYQEKFENFYYKILKDKSVMFYEKFEIIDLLLKQDLIIIEDKDRELFGRKLWDILRSGNKYEN